MQELNELNKYNLRYSPRRQQKLAESSNEGETGDSSDSEQKTGEEQ